jgi:hypothetical protein
MAAISLFWYTNMAAVTSDENDLYFPSFRTFFNFTNFIMLFLAVVFDSLLFT